MNTDCTKTTLLLLLYLGQLLFSPEVANIARQILRSYKCAITLVQRRIVTVSVNV